MRLLPTRVHGILDYLIGALLIAAPWLFSFARGGAETWVPVILGAGVIAYSLFTNYELGAVRAIPMNVHLMLDMAGGVVLAASPWVFGFSDVIVWPHVAVGLLEIGAAAITSPTPFQDAALDAPLQRERDRPERHAAGHSVNPSGTIDPLASSGIEDERYRDDEQRRRNVG